MDEALARAIVDLSGRPYFIHEGESEAQIYHLIGGHFTGAMTRHVFESFTHHAAINTHIDLLSGRDQHNIVEVQLEALVLDLRYAYESTYREGVIIYN